MYTGMRGNLTSNGSVKLVWAILALWSAVALAVPTANPDSVTTSEDTPVSISVLANDTSSIPAPLSLVAVTQPTHGTTSIQGDQVVYTPEPDFCGLDVFTYTVSDGGGTDTGVVTIQVICTNDAPVAEDATLSTLIGQPITVQLRAYDPDIDPLNPDLHPLKFEITEGPYHGTISGDLTIVTYLPLHEAVAEVIYTPDPGFVGRDRFVFKVTDPSEEFDTGVIEIEVRQALAPPSLIGVWSAILTLEGSQTWSITLDSKLTVGYSVNDMRFEATSTFSEEAWESLRLFVRLPLGEFITLTSLAAFDPVVPAFEYWNAVARFGFGEIDFTYTFYLSSTPENSTSVLVARWSGDVFSLTSTTQFKGCSLSFAQETLLVTWSYCDYRITGKLSVLCDGFESFTISIYNILIFGDPQESFWIDLDLKVEFTTIAKTVTPTLRIHTDWVDCIRFLTEILVSDEGLEIEGFTLYGIHLKSQLTDSLTVEAKTSLSEDKNAAITGYADYFEVFQLTGRIFPCCGSPGQWKVAVYFDATSGELFSWGMTHIRLEDSLAEGVRLIIDTKFYAVDPKWQISLGWKVTW